MKNFAVPLYCVLMVCILSSFACNNDTPISSQLDLIDPGDRGTIQPPAIMAPVADSTGFDVVNTAGGTFLLLGAFDNVESRILVRFAALPDSVVDAKLKLPAHVVMGTGANFAATVHEVTTRWDEAKITWGDNNFPVEFNPAAMDTQQITSSSVDTTVFHLDPLLLKDSTGVLIQPHGAAFLKEFHSRVSLEKQPFLELTAVRNGRNETTRHAATASVFVFRRSTKLSEGPLYVGNGEKHQSVFSFNLEALPKNATINRAELTLEVDTLSSTINADEFSAALFLILEDIKLSPLKLDSLETPADTVQFLQRISVSPSMTSVTFVVTNAAQFWVQEPSRNYGLALLPDFPARDLSRVAFFSRETNLSRAPKLRIEYTTPPKVP
jgi:hypothetical protein